jgi:hypothetical protein
MFGRNSGSQQRLDVTPTSHHEAQRQLAALDHAYNHLYIVHCRASTAGRKTRSVAPHLFPNLHLAANPWQVDPGNTVRHASCTCSDILTGNPGWVAATRHLPLLPQQQLAAAALLAAAAAPPPLPVALLPAAASTASTTSCPAIQQHHQ